MTPNTIPKPDQVHAARRLLGWSREDLAANTGLSLSFISDFEDGELNPTPNEALTILQVIESSGVIFTETAVSYGFIWTFMTERSTYTLTFAYAPDSTESVFDFASIFGKVEPSKISINNPQRATSELRKKIHAYVNEHGTKSPHLFSLRKMVDDMADGEFFFILSKKPSSTAEEFLYGQLLHKHNHPLEQSLEESFQVFDCLLERYNIWNPRTDKDAKIGNARKASRTCRFCGKSKETGAQFHKVAHAIPAALGNKYLKLADECDNCNKFFGDEIEPTLVEFLNTPRVLLGIEARGGLPTVNFSGGKLYRKSKNDKTVIVVSDKHYQDDSGTLTVELGTGKSHAPQTFYRALSKIALSVIPENELTALQKTIKWTRYGEYADSPLPKIASALVRLPSNPSAQITLYIRKAPHPKLPHVVCEFRLGCFMYVYALPFSEKDEGNLLGFFEEEDFKQTFMHYNSVPSWRQQDYSKTQKVMVSQKIKLIPESAPIMEKPSDL